MIILVGSAKKPEKNALSRGLSFEQIKKRLITCDIVINEIRTNADDVQCCHIITRGNNAIAVRATEKAFEGSGCFFQRFRHHSKYERSGLAGFYVSLPAEKLHALFKSEDFKEAIFELI